ncbi:MAG: hypothetical protein HYT14_02690, partial [Candidatus Liptonbacteria bacterium]|nr:hypothetical protein [Candidatus Liptonbacteria bacterium]
KKEQLEEPQGEAGFVQGPGGQTFIRQPNGTLTPYNLPAAPRLTLDQEIDRLLVDWASGSPTGAKSLSQAHALDSQRDLIEAQRGLSYPDAVQLAISQAKTPEEARHWIDVLTNPFADPYAPSQDLLAADYTQSVQAGQAEPDPLVTAYVDNTYGFVTEGVGKTPDQAKYAPKGQQPFPATGLFGASMEDIIGASGIKDPFTGKSYPIFKQPQVQRPYGQEDDLFAAAPPTSVKKSNLDPREDEEGPVSPFPTTQPKVQQPYGEEDSLSFAAASPQSGVLDEIAAKGGVTAGGIAIYNPQTGDIKFSSADQEEDLLKAYPGYQVAAKGPPKPKTPQAAIQGTAGLLNPFTKPQPGNNPMYSPKTGDGLLNPFESTLYTIEQRRRQKKKQSDFERSAPLTARFS